MHEPDQPDTPDAYADLVAAMVDTNSGTVKPDRPMTWAETRIVDMHRRQKKTPPKRGQGKGGNVVQDAETRQEAEL